MKPPRGTSGHARGGRLCRGLAVCAAVVLAALPAAHAAELAWRAYEGLAGIITIPVYIHGHCRFQCVTPEGWAVNLTPPDGDAVRFMPLGTSTAYIAVSVTPVSLAEKQFASWRIPDLKRSLTAGRAFVIEGEADGHIEGTPSWRVWGTVSNTVAGAAGGDSGLTAEYHSFHINHGYLIDLSLHAPLSSADECREAYRLVGMTFRSVRPGSDLSVTNVLKPGE
ncbi:hypothetical protein GX586_06815 [bacterium]|nr:hypothetical protein [bacterium]